VSRIPSANRLAPANVTVITGQDLEDRGFKNVFDALNTLSQNTGFTQGADYGNTFTPAANTISLRGLGPNHTLVLIDGRRVVDYPVAYNGAQNFVNLANIPAAAIERIEILQGGASAIYGSDAIAGVVNVILKDQAQGLDVNVKAGMTQHGGGGDGRLQLTGGHTFDKLTATFAIEVSRTAWPLAGDLLYAEQQGGSERAPMDETNIIARVHGQYLASASYGLPDPNTSNESQVQAIAEIPEHGKVLITFKRMKHKRGKGTHTWWGATHVKVVAD